MKTIMVSTNNKEEIIDVTHHLHQFIEDEKISNGYVFVHVPHTTAGLTINENADPDVKRDILHGLRHYDRGDYHHGEGNSPAHIKSSLMGNHKLIRVEHGRPMLGTWQGLMFCEFDGPRKRDLWMDLL